MLTVGYEIVNEKIINRGSRRSRNLSLCIKKKKRNRGPLNQKKKKKLRDHIKKKVGIER